MTDPPPLAAELAPLSFLLGAWSGEGEGDYPTIEPFRYREEVTFTHVGKPFLVYGQRTVNMATGLPAHAETGYWRPVGDDRVELILAHPSGLVEVAEGTVRGTRVEVASTTVGRTGTAKQVDTVERVFEVDGDVLRYELRMAAVGRPLTHHLAAELHRHTRLDP